MSKKTTINGTNNINMEGNNNHVSVNNYHPEKLIKKVEVIQHNTDIHISSAQQARIKELVDEIGDMMKDCDTQNYYMKTFAAFKKKYQIPKYNLLPIELFDDAVAYLKKQKTFYRKSLLTKNAKRFKEVTIPLIKIRWKYLKRDENTLTDFASLKLNKEVNDLNRLSVNDLDTLYTRVYSLKK